jgi:hypothetical protein
MVLREPPPDTTRADLALCAPEGLALRAPEGLASLAPGTRAFVEQQLEPGERIVWCAPQRRIWRWQIDVLPIVFGTFLAGYALYGVIGLFVVALWGMSPADIASMAAFSQRVLLAGLLTTMLLGLVMIALPLLWTPWWSSRTANVLTDRRAMIVVGHLFTGKPAMRAWRRGEVVCVAAFACPRWCVRDTHHDRVLRHGLAHDELPCGDIDFDLRNGRTEQLAPTQWASTSAAKSPFGGAGFPGVRDIERVAALAHTHLVEAST